MIFHDRRVLSTQAEGFGFIRDTFEKVLRLTAILNYMEGDPLLSRSLALKGGTAINLVIFDLPRLSVDIDLDYAFNNSLDEMKRDRREITDVLRRYMTAEGYELSGSSKSYHSLDSFVYVFANSAGIRDNIKIEINYSMRCHVLPLTTGQIDLTGVVRATNVLMVAPMEIFASKIVALLNRTAARDLFDVNNMVTLNLFTGIESAILRKCVVFYHAVGGDRITADLNTDKVFSLTNHNIRTSLQPVLRKRDRFDLSSAQERIKKYLTNLLVLEENERSFLEFFANGEYKPELLFDGEILTRIQSHPMAAWKMQRTD
jgi:predicted nucleotidyltransferase component of viral defense system